MGPDYRPSVDRASDRPGRRRARSVRLQSISDTDGEPTTPPPQMGTSERCRICPPPFRRRLCSILRFPLPRSPRFCPSRSLYACVDLSPCICPCRSVLTNQTGAERGRPSAPLALFHVKINTHYALPNSSSSRKPKTRSVCLSV